MEIDWILLGVLGLFFAGMLVIGAWASRLQKTAADFYVGGRRFGTLTVTATQMASAFGGGMMVAHVGLGYAYGMAEMVYLLALSAGVVLLARRAGGRRFPRPLHQLWPMRRDLPQSDNQVFRS